VLTIVLQGNARLPAVAAPLLRGLTAWLLCLGILGCAVQLLSRARPVPPGFTDRVLPAYLLGQPVILALGWVLLPWRAGAGVKFAVVVSASLLAVFLLTEGVRRIGILRYLFGLTPVMYPSGGKT
jgi:hypothetical protein